MTASEKSKRLFVSYAVSDRAVADAFVDLLRLGCDLNEGEVFFTDRPGTIPAGTLFTEAIKTAIFESEMAILLLTPSYYESRFCLAELGAIWNSGATHVPLLVPPVSYADLEGVQLAEHALRIDGQGDLDQLRDEVGARFGRSVATATWNAKRDQFLQKWAGELRDAVAEPSKVAYGELVQVRRERDRYETDARIATEARDRTQAFAMQLKADNQRLREGGDATVPAPSPKLGNEQAIQTSEALQAIEIAKAAMASLPAMVAEAIFQDSHASRPLTVGGTADKYTVADARKYLEYGFLTPYTVDEHELTPRADHPQVGIALAALTDVRAKAFPDSRGANSSVARDWLRPSLLELYGVEDYKFELRTTWEALGFLPSGSG